jgi:excisionase family DNA binding protein
MRQAQTIHPGASGITIAQAAAVAKVTRQAMNRWVRNGQISAERIGSVWIINIQSLADFLRERDKREARISQLNGRLYYVKQENGRCRGTGNPQTHQGAEIRSAQAA